jgi:hypothetical protein
MRGVSWPAPTIALNAADQPLAQHGPKNATYRKRTAAAGDEAACTGNCGGLYVRAVG